MPSFLKGKLLYVVAPILILGSFALFFWLTSLLLSVTTDITYLALFILIILLQFDWRGIVKKLRAKKATNKSTQSS